MKPINMLEAKSSLSRLVDAIERGQEREIVIARNGRPAAKLVPLESAPVECRIGVAKGKFEVPENIDRHNDEVARLFRYGTDK
ncbi:type II toxin-antitoxin system Phd/YefM family antitoxin [Rugamonas apoptosis]|uniref:Antitoxin n=1 Tax=Rugamonas apoptosis TaxID=2758570 RepID=A0A7W2F6A5_9BURK|nr:type II toxin-antitoxin system prevent-host-death family antitoxin [Rugamonas apoptosis]MBA5685930.1 type II toxin-antitoxin system prevent-host-death family antitoxin [Rugamonas apoptosis]